MAKGKPKAPVKQSIPAAASAPSEAGYIDDAKRWYHENKTKYDKLRLRVQSILEDSMQNGDVEFLYVLSRLKSEKRFVDKIRRNRDEKRDDKPDYSHESVTDTAGIRVVTRLRSERETVSDLINVIFEIDEKESIDKEQSLDFNQVGYRATHWIAKFDRERCELKDFSSLKEMWFEIQVCSIMEHGWSESQHGGYEIAGKLPDDIMRRYMLLAANVESADREFEQLAGEVKGYIKSVEDQTKSPDIPEDFLDAEINSINLRAFLRQRCSSLNNVDWDYSDSDIDSSILDELAAMEVTSLRILGVLIKEKYFKFFNQLREASTIYGVIRDILIIHDPDRYFKVAWNHHWGGVMPDDEELWGKMGVDVSKIWEYLDGGDLP